MKLEKWIACLESAVLSFLLSFSACMCIPSAFVLTADTSVIALLCGIGAVLFSVCYTLRLGLLPPLLLAFSAGYFWSIGTLADSVEGLLFHISRIYDMAYSFGWFYWSETPPYYADITAALCAAGCLICMVTAFTVCRRKWSLPAIILPLLPLAACLVVTDRIPETVWLFLLLLGLAVLILSQSVRREDTARGNRLTAMAVIPAALALALLFWAIPRDTYRGQQRADQFLLQMEQLVQDWSGNAVTSPADDTVSLSQTGQLLSLHTPVMTVNTDHSFTLYLRGQGYQMYDGKNWYNEYGDDPYRWMDRSAFVNAGKIHISTRDLHLMQFVPYYADWDDEKLSFLPTHGMYENKGLLYSYGFDLLRPSADTLSSYVDPPDGGLQFPVGVISPDAVSLPADTVSWAEPLALSLIEGKQTIREQADAIAAYVRSSASYSRGTGRMPTGEKDFARWFLEESDTGYCVHFATATAVLLRSVGIHAQYVTGYLTSTEAGEDVVVYQDQAHAWVEYYDPAFGWRVLESTPADGLPSVQTSQEVTPGISTPPTVTAPTESAAQPTEPSLSDPQEEDPWTGLYWLCLILVAILAVIAQWQLRLRLRENRMHTGATNARALVYWREIARLCRLLGTKPEQALHTLAQKAKFSQHKLTRQELLQLEDGLTHCHRALKAKPKYMQILYTLIFAVY